MHPETLNELRRAGRAELADSSADQAAIDADTLLMHIADCERSDLIAHAERKVPASSAQAYRAAIERRRSGEPVAYILGVRGFWTLDLGIDEHALIPRPETEMLVSLALEHGRADQPLEVLDLCTGSGAVALAIASERPNWRITASDISSDALALARRNARNLKLANTEFIEGDLFTPLNGRGFDLIVANPPYIREDDPHLSLGDLRYEPKLALVAGPDGLDIIRPLIAQSVEHIRAGGMLLIEHGHDQRDAVLALAQALPFSKISDLDDLAGNPRVLRATV